MREENPRLECACLFSSQGHRVDTGLAYSSATTASREGSRALLFSEVRTPGGWAWPGWALPLAGFPLTWLSCS